MEREGINEPKISVYWQAAKDTTNAQVYLETSMHMSFRDKNNFNHYRKFLSYNYPGGFPDGYVDLAKKSSGICSLSKKVSEQYKIELHSGTYEEVFFNN